MSNIKNFPSNLATAEKYTIDFGDGDDGGNSQDLDNITINKVDNGWVVSSTSVDEHGELGAYTFVFNTDNAKFNGNLEAVKHIIEVMGLKGFVKVEANK